MILPITQKVVSEAHLIGPLPRRPQADALLPCARQCFFTYQRRTRLLHGATWRLVDSRTGFKSINGLFCSSMFCFCFFFKGDRSSRCHFPSLRMMFFFLLCLSLVLLRGVFFGVGLQWLRDCAAAAEASCNISYWCSIFL